MIYLSILALCIVILQPHDTVIIFTYALHMTVCWLSMGDTSILLE
jgi:hypothetical protein